MDNVSTETPPPEQPPEIKQETPQKEVTPPKDPLAVKFMGIKEGFSTSVNTLHLQSRITMPDHADGSPPLTLNQIFDQRAQMKDQKEGVVKSSAEIVTATSQLLGEITYAIEKNKTRDVQLYLEEGQKENELQMAKHELAVEESKGRIGRMISSSKRRELEFQIRNSEHRLALIHNEKLKLRDEGRALFAQQSVVADERRDALIKELVSTVDKTKGEYVEFLKEMYARPELVEGVLERWIQDTLVPDIDDYPQAKPELKNEFLEGLRTIARKKMQEFGGVTSYDMENNEMNAFEYIHQGSGYGDLIRKYRDTIMHKGLYFENFIAGILSEDIVGMRTRFKDDIGDRYGWTTDFDTPLKELFPLPRYGSAATTPPSESKLNMQVIDSVFGNEKSQSPQNMWELSVWEAFRSDSNMKRIFGESIAATDAKYFEHIKSKSLTDQLGNFIDMLSSYPNPESIKTLVLLGSAEPYGYRITHVDSALARLARRQDWSTLLSEAEAAYPDLLNVREKLLLWKRDQDQGGARLRDDAQGLIKNTLASDATNLEKEVAIEGLELSSLLEHLIHAEVITEETKTNYLEVVSQMRDFEKKRREGIGIEGRSDLFKVDTTNLPDRIRIETLRYVKHLLLNGKVHSINLGRNVVFDTGRSQRNMEALSRYSAELVKHLEHPEILVALTSHEFVSASTEQLVQPAILAEFISNLKPLMHERMQALRSFIWENAAFILRDSSDVKFLQNVVGEFGKQADGLLRGYTACVKEGVVTPKDRDVVIEFARQFRTVSPTIISAYKEAKAGGHQEVLIAKLRSLAERMTGKGTFTDEERNSPLYKDILRHVYPNNSGQWTSYELNESCEDRSQDLEGLHIRSVYEIDLLSQGEVRIKEGQTLQVGVLEKTQEPLYRLFTDHQAVGFDREQIADNFTLKLDAQIELLKEAGVKGADLSILTKPEEKLFLLLVDSMYGGKYLDAQIVKDLLVEYEFSRAESIKDYIDGTNDKISGAENQNYALLCELNTFYTDRMKEAGRRIISEGWSNPELEKAMPEYFKKLTQTNVSDERQKKIHQLQLNKRGLSDGLITQVRKLLDARRVARGKELKSYTDEEIKEIIQRYETRTSGLTQQTTSENKSTKQFFGMLRSERERTFQAVKVLTGEDVDPARVHLGELNLQQLLTLEAKMGGGVYDAEQFGTYTVQRIIDLFEDESLSIQGELGKFESLSGGQREMLNGYISKTKESAHARMVGGVCVSGDNPGKNLRTNMWDMPNFFQLVLQDPVSLQSQGVVMLHQVTHGGKKVLAASLNPSSTYLYTVDENALFKGLMSVIETVASDNDFDAIVISQNHAIRTNRTGGEFERAMTQRVAEKGSSLTFDPPEQFSYHPQYLLQGMDVVWENTTE